MADYKVLRTKTERMFAPRWADGARTHALYMANTAQGALNATEHIEPDVGVDVVAMEREVAVAMTVGDLLAFLATVDPALPVRTFREGQGEYGSDEDELALSVGVEAYEGGYLCISSQDHGAVKDRWVITDVAISEPEVTALRSDFVAKRRERRRKDKEAMLAKLASELGVKIAP